jgi:thiol-disulfide isomerase/thioredoxin
MTPARRKLLYGGVAAGAALAGVGAALWRFTPGPASDQALDVFWDSSFDRPEGGSLSMASLRGKPVLVNFWATWCPPCVEELPLLDSFYRQHGGKSWQVIGLAIDQPSAVRTFLARLPLSFPVGLAGFGGTELGKALGNLSGGLPFTVVFDAGGAVRQRKMGRVSPADLAAWAQAHSIP